jgi:hypothetical protein
MENYSCQSLEHNLLISLHSSLFLDFSFLSSSPFHFTWFRDSQSSHHLYMLQFSDPSLYWWTFYKYYFTNIHYHGQMSIVFYSSYSWGISGMQRLGIIHSHIANKWESWHLNCALPKKVVFWYVTIIFKDLMCIHRLHGDLDKMPLGAWSWDLIFCILEYAYCNSLSHSLCNIDGHLFELESFHR